MSVFLSICQSYVTTQESMNRFSRDLSDGLTEFVNTFQFWFISGRIMSTLHEDIVHFCVQVIVGIL
jgi:hypothetical protein